MAAKPTTAKLMKRITINPRQCGGRPCIRGMRIRVSDVLELLAAGYSQKEVVEELDDLQPADVLACLAYAAAYMNHPRLVA